MKLNAFVVVAVLAAGAIATGCGSSDDNGDSTTTASLTKAEWIAKADAICRQGNQQINQAYPRHRPGRHRQGKVRSERGLRQVLCRWERTGPAVRTQGLRQVVG